MVIAAGCSSVAIAKSIGIRLPLYPMLGYSITCDVASTEPAVELPQGLLILEPLHLYVIRMDAARVRFASIAQFSGWNEQLFDPAAIMALRSRITTLFPQLAPRPRLRCRRGCESS